MSLERNASRLGAVMIMEGSWFQAIIVRGKKENIIVSIIQKTNLQHSKNRKSGGVAIE